MPTFTELYDLLDAFQHKFSILNSRLHIVLKGLHLANVVGKDSGYLRNNARKRAWFVMVLMILMVIATSGLAFFSFINRGKLLLTYGASGLSLCIYLFIKKYSKSQGRNIDSYLSGEAGENVVYDELLKLPDNYYIFVDVHLPGHKDNIDFVVYGPTGLFTIEVKSHKGLIDFDGSQLTKNFRHFAEKDILRQAKSQAMQLHDYVQTTTNLYEFVTPVIAFASPWAQMKFGMKKVDDNVFVVNKKWLNQIIYKQNNNIKSTENSIVTTLSALCSTPAQ